MFSSPELVIISLCHREVEQRAELLGLPGRLPLLLPLAGLAEDAGQRRHVTSLVTEPGGLGQSINNVRQGLFGGVNF